MRLRTFTAANMGEAIRLVRDELGPDAVILSTETAGRSVKITAALDRAAILEPAPLLAPDPLDAIAAALDFHGVPPLLADRLVAIAESFLLENPRQALGAALRARFGFNAILPPSEDGRPIMLVGLPGAGKTATLAKLAAAAKTAQRSTVAVTCDLTKAGGIDQLAVYAKAIGMTAYQAKNPAALKRAIDAAPADSLVLIDTVGTNPLRAEDLAHLTELAAAAKAEPVLVIGAGGDVTESAEQAQLFAEIGCQRMIPAKIDAARRYGGLLAGAEGGKLAFAECGTSPEIAKGVMFLGADALARLLMPQESAQAIAPGAKRAHNGARAGSGSASAAGTAKRGAGTGTRKKPLESGV